MNDPRESDLLRTDIDLVDLSTLDERESMLLQTMNENETTTASKGLCIKEYEDKMDNLKKENFNLKLRLYFYEEKSGAFPEGTETLHKQVIDLKVEKESLVKELDEKQELLYQASKALEILENERKASDDNAEKEIAELKEKIQMLEEELQQNNEPASKSSSDQRNDTGYADFFNAVDIQRSELQRKYVELCESAQIAEQQLQKLKAEKDEITTKYKETRYERDELRQKFDDAEAEAKDSIQQLDEELKECKRKLADTQCDLLDAEAKYQKSEEERKKTFNALKRSVDVLEEEREKIAKLELVIKEKQPVDVKAKDVKKDEEIAALKTHIAQLKNQLKEITSVELGEKNKEIQRLTELLNQMHLERHSLTHDAVPRFSLDHILDEFNDLKFQQAMEIKKQSQAKIDELLLEIQKLASSKTQQHQVSKLKSEMEIVVEKQKVADSALTRCAELCSYTLEHLHELAMFLASMLQIKEVRESLSEQSFLDIQHIIDQSLNMSARHSIGDHLTSLPNLSNLDILMQAARESIGNIRELRQCVAQVDKSIQITAKEECKNCVELMEREQHAKDEYEELKRVNQLLEDEICEARDKITTQKNCNEKLKEDFAAALKKVEEEADLNTEEYQMTIEALEKEKNKVEKKLVESEEELRKFKEQYNDVLDDINENWIEREQHEAEIIKLQEEIVNGEAQIAAIRMELDAARNAIQIAQTSNKENVLADHEQSLIDESKQVMTRRTIEISDDRKILMMSTENSTSTSIVACNMCPKYKTQISELKKYLGRAVETLQKQKEQKAIVDRHIQKQLNKTENFLQQARTNMENIVHKQGANSK